MWIKSEEGVILHEKTGRMHPEFYLWTTRETIDFNQKRGKCYTNSFNLTNFYGKRKSYPYSYDNTMDNF